MRFEDFTIPMDSGERILELMRGNTFGGDAKLEMHGSDVFYLSGIIGEEYVHFLAEIAKDFLKPRR